MEKSISNIEEYNRTKNEIIIDQDIIDEVFTEKTKNDISSSASFYSVSRNSFDDVGLDFFYNEYNGPITDENINNLLVGSSNERLKFYYLDIVDIYGINSNLRNNSDIPVISNTAFKNPDYLLGSINNIHAYIDFSQLKFKNSCITDANNHHYYVPKHVDVVLKAMKPTNDKQKVKMDVKFINEWVCVQRFVPVYGVSTYLNEDVLVTQYYKNGSIGQYLKNNSTISLEEKEEFVLEIVEALDICHSHGIVHGNLKPSNILLNEYYHVLLCDFSMNEMSPTNPNSIQRQWLAPELREHSVPLTPASDVYSLGLIIYYIFNDGIRYYPSSDQSDYLEKDWPENIRTILHHCLQVKPSDRWTIKDILSNLKAHYQFGSIADKYLNRQSLNNYPPPQQTTSIMDSSKSKRGNYNYGQGQGQGYGQEHDPELSNYNRYPKLERFRKFNRYNQYHHQEDTSSNSKHLKFAVKTLKHSLYLADWNYTQAMKLMTGTRDVACNFQKGIQRLFIPCSEGHVDSILRLGLCYYDGKGIAKNITKASNLWDIAVEIFPNRHILGGKYQQINKNLMAKSLLNSPSSNYLKSTFVGNGNGNGNGNGDGNGNGNGNGYGYGSIITSPLARPISSQSNSYNNKDGNLGINIKSPSLSKTFYKHNNGSNYSFESLLQKKQNLRGFMKSNERTFELWKEVAERKYVPAYVIIGKCYRDGILVESDVAKALIWFKRAAHMNNIEGCWYLALCYFIYYDNYQDAYYWLTKASKKQNAKVDTALGLMYYYGIGVSRELHEALDHFQYAADLGNANAQYLYCECLDYLFREQESQKANTITNDERSIHYDKLFHYCSMAATQGHARAQFLLGKLYLDGSLKLIKNDSSSHKFNSSIGLQWIRLSAENGYKRAKEFLIEIL